MWHVWGKRVVYTVLLGIPDSERPLGRPRRNFSIILKLIFKKWGGESWISGSIKCGAFVDQLKTC
jgi:hypothetical protein